MSQIMIIPDIEIRGHEVKTSKKDGKPYMVVRYEDQTGKSFEILDRDMDREQFYKRGTLGSFYAEVDIGRNFSSVRVSEFKIGKTVQLADMTQ